MATEQGFETLIVAKAEQLAGPPRSDTLRFSGLSVVCYFIHRVAGDPMAEAIANGVLNVVEGPLSYREKLRPGANLTYSSLVPSGAIPSAVAEAAGATPGAPLRQSIVALTGDYLLSAVPITVTTEATADNLIRIAVPLDVDRCLEILRTITSASVSEPLVRQIRHHLAGSGLVTEAQIEQSWFLADSLAIQAWDLGGTRGRKRSKLYEGVRESKKYAWEISALLTYPSDHIRADGLWRERSRDQVFNDVQTGFGFFEDHMVFVNGVCCLEMAHIPAWLRDRSRFRLEHYGYDSSSIFVWTVALLRAATIENLGSRYGDLVARLLTRRDLPADEQMQYARQQVAHLSMVEEVAGFRNLLSEPRNRALDDRISQLRGTNRAASTVRQEIEKSNRLVSDLASVRDQAIQSRTNTFLGALTVALALVGVPSVVAQVASWIACECWVQVGVSALFVIVVIVITVIIWRLRR